ncbi:nuclear transport factor 2 family protein [Sneathiella sp. HT1-7]|uniref:nuclear transport factor 2 family protein n=1 Tax=Sneathiella sp. HT1-7 TaxID=2887192 RepID=UPI001D1472F6|nr:nuclear transport factor 2 family protein [Sneathiella sp. HT1-7]MCC3303363.1 nuclear transport factor 2 family protein [Sneathiella sp. HT1-7]
MNTAKFKELLKRFSAAAEAGDGEAFAACFTENGVYHDYIYGDHQGRAEIAHMMSDQFHRDAGEDYRWEMFDPMCEGNLAYAWSLSSFTSTVPEFEGKQVVIDGMSRFELKDGLISDYRESVNGGVAMAQLGVQPERLAKICAKWGKMLIEQPETQEYLARSKGSWKDGS